ncbi:hypothetical protein PLESTB_001052200 [Pleodorina starrii]|uniref:Selenoprotein H n=1 Tax=Pleodorina starrii TaxID=330485 RepID=A0A9W6BQM1_9CHLO|nr:hypothetical protein PLESTB_001052200 [Pleodorina starrii]
MAPKRKAAGEAKAEKAPAKKQTKKEETATLDAASAKGIVIEAWATKLEKLLKEALPGTDVSINPEKPRKGCFEVRGPDGKVFVSLLDMPRPFTKLKALDVEALATEIADALKA